MRVEGHVCCAKLSPGRLLGFMDWKLRKYLSYDDGFYYLQQGDDYIVVDIELGEWVHNTEAAENKDEPGCEDWLDGVEMVEIQTCPPCPE